MIELLIFRWFCFLIGCAVVFGFLYQVWKIILRTDRSEKHEFV